MKLDDHFEAVAKRLIENGEKLMPLGQACAFVNRARGEKVSPSSLCRWILRGKNGVRLDAIRMNGGGWHTSKEALIRFAAALSARAAGEALAPPETSPTELERRAEAARARLRAQGVKC